MDIMNKFNKAIDLLKTKYLMKFKQKTFVGNDYEINYLLEKNSKSSDLLIVFSLRKMSFLSYDAYTSYL